MKNDETATTGGSVKGKDKKIEVIENKEKDSVGAYRRACGSKTDGSTGTDPQTGKKFKCAQAPKGQEPTETETFTTTKIEEGDDLDYNADLYKKKEDKVVQGPSNTRMQERSKIFTNRKVNKYRRKLGKYGTFDMEGNFTPNENLSQRDIRKMLQAKGNLEGSQAGRKNVQEGLESGTGLKGKYYGGQRKMDKGELINPSKKSKHYVRQSRKENVNQKGP